MDVLCIGNVVAIIIIIIISSSSSSSSSSRSSRSSGNSTWIIGKNNIMFANIICAQVCIKYAMRKRLIKYD